MSDQSDQRLAINSPVACFIIQYSCTTCVRSRLFGSSSDWAITRFVFGDMTLGLTAKTYFNMKRLEIQFFHYLHFQISMHSQIWCFSLDFRLCVMRFDLFFVVIHSACSCVTSTAITQSLSQPAKHPKLAIWFTSVVMVFMFQQRRHLVLLFGDLENPYRARNRERCRGSIQQCIYNF